MIRQVVVGVDGSEHALSAFNYARYLAGRQGCELKAVFVVDSRKTELPIVYATGHFDYAFARTYVPPDPELKSFYAKIKRDQEEFGRNLLEVCHRECEQAGIPFLGVQREGLPSTLLAEESRSGDLLLIGQKGENARFERTIVGSTTEDVVRSSPRPVMVCPQGFRPPLKLLFPYDGSVTAERALQFAVNALGSFWTELVLLVDEEHGGGPEEDRGRTLERELRYLEQHDITHRLVSEKGSPVETVPEVARREGSDLILVGSHGRHRIKDYLLGSTTVHLIRRSDLPVLVVY